MLYLGKQECHNYINIPKKNSTPEESFIKPGQFMLVYPNKEDDYFHYTSPSHMWDYNGNVIENSSYYGTYTIQFECLLTNQNNVGYGSFDFNDKTGGKYGTWTRGDEVVEYDEENVVIMDIPSLRYKYSGMVGYTSSGGPEIAYNIIVDMPANYKDGDFIKIHGAEIVSTINPDTMEMIPTVTEFTKIVQINGDILKIEDGKINMYRNNSLVATLEEPYASLTTVYQDIFFELKQVHDTTTNKRTYEVIEPNYQDDGTYEIFTWLP